MSKIHILPDDIANQIAAGEVVERPASVVKELLENALDAGATRLRVEIEGGGRQLIRVTDDGEGMTPEDARLCVQRHATSKLRVRDDLFSIRTLGFRGEAIPSIASVSRFTLETQADQSAGTRIEVLGGKLVSVQEGAFPRGTQIAVEDLFFNVPARRKFLRSESYELSQITSYCTHYALAFPGAQFILRSGAYEVLATMPVETYRERLFQVFGGDLLAELVEFRKDLGRSGIRIHLFASRPHVQKLNRSSMFFFINGRLVRDRILLHAISDAYRNILPSRTFPVAIVYLTIPFGDVDVNVHPAKTEVRFKHQSYVHDALRDAIIEGLTEDKTLVPVSAEGRPSSPYSMPGPPPRVPDSWQGGVLATQPFSLSPAAETRWTDALPLTLNFRVPPSTSAGCGDIDVDEAAPTSPDFEQIRSEIRVFGQLKDAFIVGADATGLVLVDQHVAHERVLFEAYVKQRLQGTPDVQRLLIPLIVELSPRQMVVLDRLIPELLENGFEVEVFGAKSVAVKTAPAILKAGAVERLLFELLDGLDRETQAIDMDALKRKVAATVSCHAAIKINTPLDDVKMKWLVTELMKCDVPTVCPHGRPIVLRYDFREILKGFKRL